MGRKTAASEGVVPGCHLKQIENRGVGWGGDQTGSKATASSSGVVSPGACSAGDGAFGQYGIVFTEQDAVLVITSASMRLQAVLTSVWRNFCPVCRRNLCRRTA